jgi:hypothetical protein
MRSMLLATASESSGTLSSSLDDRAYHPYDAGSTDEEHASAAARHGRVSGAAPSSRDPYGATPHGPLAGVVPRDGGPIDDGGFDERGSECSSLCSIPCGRRAPSRPSTDPLIGSLTREPGMASKIDWYYHRKG